MMTCDDDEWMVRMRLWFGTREDLLLLLMLLLHVLRMQTTAKLLGSSNPFIIYFPLKLIDADHGLHISGDVQISLLAVMIEISSWFRSTLKDASGWEIAKFRFHDRIMVFSMLVVSKIL